MKIPTREEVEALKSQYEGKRIELVEMVVDPHPVEPGTVGTCEMVDGAGHLMMKWDDGRSLNLLPGVDRFKVIEENAWEPALAEFQKANCKGCRFADTPLVGTGRPCCTYAFKLDIEGGKCHTRREEKDSERYPR